jgi:hypothetical protein
MGGALASLLICAGGCGGAHRSHTRTHTVGGPVATAQPRGPAVGLTEDNADLLWSPYGSGQTGGQPFQATRLALTALHPTYLRVLVDWAVLQPHAGQAPTLEAPVSGCARTVAPCGPYAGLRAELAAISSQQRAGGAGAFQVVVVIYGVPSWAALGPSGCELAGAAAFSRALRPAAIAGYRALIRSLLSLAASQGVSLRWWSPWNEPNDPRFISPQRASCAADAPSLAPGVYAQLARAMVAELELEQAPHQLILGELNNLQRESPHTTSIARFVAELPSDVLCLAKVWSVHAYAARHPTSASLSGVQALEQALDARGGCPDSAPIWVTEAGAGAPHPGRPRIPGMADQLAGCRELARQLLGGYGDPRVGAVFQYSFREDPTFPVGLVSADLSHTYPAYRLWLAYARLRAEGRPPPTPEAGCA